MEARNCASLGTRINGDSYFEEAPFFLHRIKGIFISDYAHIGKNVTIFQQVTIGVKNYEMDWIKNLILEITYLLEQEQRF